MMRRPIVHILDILVVFAAFMVATVPVVHGACHQSTATAITDFWNPLMSDSDGVHSSAKPDPDSDCTYTLQCPAGMFLRVVSLHARIYGRCADEYLQLVYKEPATIIGPEPTMEITKKICEEEVKPNIGFTAGDTVKVRLVTDGLVDSQGFTLRWSCHHGMCLRNLSSYILDGATSGTLLSDDDGRRGTIKYANNERCSYTLKCPDPSFVMAITGLDFYTTTSDYLQLEYKIDEMDQLQTYGRSDGTFGLKADGHSLLGLTNSSEMRVNFSTTNRDVLDGWQLDYQCYTAQCSRNLTSYELTGSTEGRIMSDPDGYQGNHWYANNERCFYTIECPSGFNIAVTAMRYVIQPMDDYLMLHYTLDDQPAALVYQSHDHLTNHNVLGLTNSSTLHVNFTTDGKTVRDGWNLDYKCYTAQCSMNLSSYDIVAYEGQVLSDVDGRKSDIHYINNERCFYTVTCPNGMNIAVTKVDLSLQPEDMMTVHYAIDNIAMSRRHTNGLHHRDHSAIGLTNSSTLHVNFTSDAKRTMDGFTLDYKCYTAQCSWNQSSYNIVEYSGELKSDNDGRNGAIHYMNNERCFYTVSCPAGMVIRIKDIPHALEVGDNLTITYSLDGITTQRVHKGGMTYDNHRRIGLTNSSTFHMAFETNEQGTGDGWSLSYDCFKSQCSRNLSSYDSFGTSGILRSDPNGKDGGSLLPLNNERCFYHIYCPLGMNLAVTNINFHVHGGDHDNLTVTSMMDEKQRSWEYTTHIHAQGHSALGLLNSSHAAVTFLSDEGTVGNGWELEYKCYTSQCSSNYTNFTFTNFPGRIQSDKDGDGPTHYTNQERCFYEVVCPSGHYAMVSDVIAHMARNDQLTVVYNLDGQTVNKTYSGGGFNTDQHSHIGLTSSNSLHVYLTSDGSGTERGFTLDYDCIPLQQCGQRLPSYDLQIYSGATVKSDKDGHGSAMYLNNERCEYTVTCANPNATSIGLHDATLSYPSNDGLDKVTVDYQQDGSPRTLIMNYSYNFHQAVLPGLTNASQMKLRFHSSEQMVSKGFEVKFDCYYHQCSSNLSSMVIDDLVRKPLGTSHFVKSDKDGVESGVQFENNERCQYHLVCPENTFLNIFDVQLTADMTHKGCSAGTQNDHLRLRDGSRDVSICGHRHLRVHHALDFSASNRATLDFWTNERGVSNGFTAMFKCSRQQCSTPGEQYVYNAQEGMVMSDADGFGSALYKNNERCMYTIDCPKQDQAVVIESVAHRFSHGDNLTIIDVVGNVILDASSGDRSNFKPGGAEKQYCSQVYIWFFSNDYHVSTGFAVKYRCEKSTLTGCPVTRSQSMTSSPPPLQTPTLDEEKERTRSVSPSLSLPLPPPKQKTKSETFVPRSVISSHTVTEAPTPTLKPTTTHPITSTAPATSSPTIEPEDETMEPSPSPPTPEPSTSTPQSTPVPETPLPTQEKLPAEKSSVVLQAVMDEKQATAVTATASASVAAVGVVSPTTASKGARGAAIASVALCDYVEGYIEPSRMMHPLYFELGSTQRAAMAGASLSTSLLIFVVVLTHLLLARRKVVNTCKQTTGTLVVGTRESLSKGEKLTLQMTSVLSAVVIAFFSGNAVNAALLVRQYEPIVTVASILLTLVPIGAVVYTVFLAAGGDGFGAEFVPEGKQASSTSDDEEEQEQTTDTTSTNETSTSIADGGSKSSSSSSHSFSSTTTQSTNTRGGKLTIVDAKHCRHFVACYEPFFDGARSLSDNKVRCYFIAEVGVGLGMGILDGWQPESGSCMLVAILMLLLQIIYCGYVFFLRPYRAKLETFFVNLIAVTQLSSAVCCVGSNVTHEPYLTIVGYLILAQSILYMGSMVALGGWYLFVRQRRLTKLGLMGHTSNGSDDQASETEETEADGNAQQLHVPLLENDGAHNNQVNPLSCREDDRDDSDL